MRTLGTRNADIDFTVQDGLRSVIDRVIQHLRFFQGSWFLNTLAGIPYIPDILGHQYDPAIAERTLHDHILSVPDVDQVRDLVFLTGDAAGDADSRLAQTARPLAFRATVVTRFGTADIDSNVVFT